jgi:hypothetical protein
MISYSQSRAQFTLPDGEILNGCYSGGDAGTAPYAVDNPDYQMVPMVGPLPQGVYTISPAHTIPHLGPCAMALTPDPSNQMYGRSGFFIHGDNAEANHSGSDGCIVAGPAVRTKVSELVAAGENRLTVTE